MKVLFVCTVATDKSGIPNVAFNLMNAIKDSNVQLGYVSINNPDSYYKNQLEKLGASLYVIYRNIFNPFKYIYQLAAVAKDYDIIHVHGNSATMVLEMIAAKIAGVSLRVAHSHSTSCNMKCVDKLMRPLFYRLCNARLACGQEAGKWLYEKKGFFVLNNGIESERFRFNPDARTILREKLNIKNKTVIGHIGNFLEVKNHHQLLKIFKEFLCITPDSILILVGSGHLLNEIKDVVKNENLVDKVIFVGSVENPQDFMSVMDVIIMPSLYEGLPLSLVEEQANGLKCLVSDTITKDVNITGNVSYASLSDSPQLWATRIKDILKENERTLQSQIAIEKIKQSSFDISSSASKLCSFYEMHLNNEE